MVATLSRRVAEAMVRESESTLQLRELPLTSPTVRTSMLWHRRLDGSAAHRWLRELIVSVCRGLQCELDHLARAQDRQRELVSRLRMLHASADPPHHGVPRAELDAADPQEEAAPPH